VLRAGCERPLSWQSKLKEKIRERYFGREFAIRSSTSA
jgi:hypothetical protein